MRIATYNVEWFTHLFDDAGRFLPYDGWSGRRDVRRGSQARALGRVFRAMDADAVMVIEAPDGHGTRDAAAALRTFAARFRLRTREVLLGFVNDTQQEIALLYDRSKLEAWHAPSELGAPRFDQQFRLDLDIDRAPERVIWSKPPLEAEVITAAGTALRIIGVHAKSKAPHGARTEAQVMAVSIANRRKQLAQCIWLRKRVEAHLALGEDLIVLGDFNDGPGLDEYETLFGRSGLEIVLGDGIGPRLFDPHAKAAQGPPSAARPTTARFRLPPDGRYLTALLDYVMLSERLMSRRPAWRIWHPFEDPECFADATLRRALLTASDHFPVSVDLDI